MDAIEQQYILTTVGLACMVMVFGMAMCYMTEQCCWQENFCGGCCREEEQEYRSLIEDYKEEGDLEEGIIT